jgi:hypothetical protein
VRKNSAAFGVAAEAEKYVFPRGILFTGPFTVTVADSLIVPAKRSFSSAHPDLPTLGLPQCEHASNREKRSKHHLSDAGTKKDESGACTGIDAHEVKK